MPANAVRQEPVGEDAQGNRYYYFSSNQEDCRLYREKPPPPHSGALELLVLPVLLHACRLLA